LADAEWQASTLQLALFTQRALPVNTDVFTAFAGAAPDSEEDRPKEGLRRQIGKIDDSELYIQITPIRVDIVLRAPPTETPLGGVQVTIGELKAELAKLARMSLEWLPKWDVPTTRLALIVRALARAESPIGAYEILARNLRSVQVRPAEMSDLIFRVNWKAKTSTIPEGYYNRLTTWSAVSILMTGTAGAAGPQVPLSSNEFASVEMDLNTPAERTIQLPVEKLTTIYKDLHQLAVEIADAGERP
jgi:hypothetical protein